MIERLYVKLQTELGVGSMAFGRLISHFGGIQGIFAAPPARLRAVGRTKKTDAVVNGDFKRADEIINQCRNNGIDIITYEDPRFPERLRQIPDPPALLYCKGRLPDIDNSVALAVVGPRKPDDYGVKAAFSLSARLARGGAVVVSGGAMGVDTEAHAGALWAKGQTVAVLGCGILFPYLMSNARLRESISNQGAVVSEFPPDAGAFKTHFPIRNRIMSGLSLGTVVVQAAAKSGALITARLAAEQGRDVFVLPGRSGEKLYAGSNMLLKDGAKPVLSVMDILEEYVEEYPHKLFFERIYDPAEPSVMKGFLQFHKTSVPNEELSITATLKTPEKAPAVNLNLGGDMGKVYEAIANGADLPDTIADYTGLDTSQVIVALTELEIGGYVTAAVGGRYKI